MRHTIRAGVSALAGCLALACGPSKTDQPVQTTSDAGKATSPAGTAADRRGTTLLRVVNALPTKLAIDVAADDSVLFSNVGYQDVTDFKELRDNVARFSVRQTAHDSVLADNRETMGDGARYTLVVLPDEKGGTVLRVLRDELVTDPATTKIRVINAATSMDNVEVTMKGHETPLFSDIDNGREAGYKEIAPTTTTLILKGETGAPVRIENLKLEPGRAYTIVLAGQWNKVKPIRFDDRLVRVGTQVSLRP